MSFSAAVKREICRQQPNKKCCAIAEAYGVLLYCNRFSGQEVRIVTGCEPFARRLPGLFWRAFGVAFDRLPAPGAGGKLICSVTSPAALAAIGDGVGIDPGRAVTLDINLGILEEDCCRVAFCRGVFLSGGAVTDPEKRYHLELVTSHFKVSRQLPVLLRELGFSPLESVRKSNYMNYFKQSEAIEDFLTTIGAPISAMHVMNAKAERLLRNEVNRRVNCETANVDKAVEAAQTQLAAIRRIADTAGLASLPDKLCETARLRLEYPELTLAELAALCHPPVSKSCLNHRLRRLVALAP